MKGKVAIVTGSNTGIGRVTAHELAKQGAHVIMACRSEEKTKPVVEEIRAATGNDAVQFVPLDLGSFESIRRASEDIHNLGLPIHLLINNAGLAGAKGTTSDGFELTFGVNHLGHFLLTNLLLDRIRESSPARIVIVASKAHYKAESTDFEALRSPTKTPTGFPEYTVSKLCNVLHAKSLAKRLEGTGVTTYSLHPGVVASDVWRKVPWPFRSLMKLFMISNEEGAKTSLYCATSSEVAEHSGRYYDECREREPSKLALDAELAETLWKHSEAWTA